MRKIKKIIFISLFLPFLANANPLVLDFFSGIMSKGVSAANERGRQKTKLSNLKSITTSYTSCVTINKIKKVKFERQARNILSGLKTIDQRVKYFEIYLSAQRGFANNLSQCAVFAEEALRK